MRGKRVPVQQETQYCYRSELYIKSIPNRSNNIGNDIGCNQSYIQHVIRLKEIKNMVSRN